MSTFSGEPHCDKSARSFTRFDGRTRVNSNAPSDISLGVSDIIVCPHSDEHGCNCRKPRAGLLIDKLSRYKKRPDQVWMIGDSPSDLIAGSLVGAQLVLIRPENAEEILISNSIGFHSLIEAAQWIAEENKCLLERDI